MGKSTPACFRIISCGGDSVEHDDLQTPESKASSDRRGWSFRKRSARHRVLSNSVTSEAPASASKDSQESISVNCQVQPDLTITEKTTEIQQKEEKTSVIQQKEEKTTEIQQKEEKTAEILQKEEKTTEILPKEEKPTEILPKEEKPAEILQKEEKTTEILQKEEETIELQQKEEKLELSSLLDSKLSIEDDTGADAPLDEHSIILIQTAVRGLLAQRVLLKQKSITKLQAVVRGHIVRSHAVGTLRCVQAIIKMQALVRARHARLQSKKEAKASQPHTYVSIEKLLSNAFARQLMEASPRTKPINIKCDPSKSDSAWKWLERWMSVSSVSNKEPHETEAAVEQHKDNLGHSGRSMEDFSVQIISISTDSESGFDASILDIHSGKSKSLQNSDQSDPKCEVKESSPSEIKNTDLVDVMEEEYLPKKEESQNEEVLNEVVEVEYFLKKEETEIVQGAPDSEEFSSMQPETEVKLISRKASNPAFIAAQSKFEELSLAAPSAKLSTSSSHGPGVESNLDEVSSANQDQPIRSEDKDSGLVGNPTSNASAVQKGSSECGTELSISSTLDSPDRSEEAGVNVSGTKTKASDKNDHSRKGENLELEAKSIVLETDPSTNNTTKLQRNESVDSVSGESLNSCIPADTAQLDKPADLSHLAVEPGSETSHQVNRLSPEASPRNSAATPELLATPSSQVSVKRKNSKGEKSRSNRKIKHSSDDKTPSNQTPDSASRSSLDQLQEHKSGKRRNSFGSAKPENKEQEPRDSSSSNSLPSYMQATESARAKTIANGSPRSSPDVHDKEIYIKKRHSLPGTNERQGSPRIHRSLSQAQQNTKGNASHSPQAKMFNVVDC
ncbi:protein IQ-DOMAIN 32-like isoform X2 [Salvia miltiorrhiza]|uniref:protein IQ-DOMAIN 32-like isoform X2 n=1 Tax=Salvia miltiorrhiza TaxID=226208 RepID=UPI0025ABFF94|nr:protein IQ-DOMAIN 32-like isoform X2 [Salvia miltiorrhiza]